MLYKELKKNYKVIIVTIIVTFLVHAYKLLNNLPSWDSMYFFKMGWAGTRESARWFSGIAKNLLSSRFDIQWVEGIESVILIALTWTLIYDILELENLRSKWVMTFLFVAFPCFAATLMYPMWSAAYLFALLLSVAAVFYSIKTDKRWTLIISILCISFSMAIYQIYVLFAVCLVLIYVAKRLLDEDVKYIDLIKPIVRSIIAVIVGAIIYLIINKVLQKIYGYGLTTYQGIGQVGLLGPQQFINAIKTLVIRFGSFSIGVLEVSFFGVFNWIIYAVSAFIILRLVILNKKYDVIRKIAIILLYVLVLPVSYAFLFVTSGELYYHMLLELSLFFLYLYPAIVLNEVDPERHRTLAVVFATLISVLCFYHFINDNVAYHQAVFSNEKTRFATSEINMEIDRINDKKLNKILVVGNFDNTEPKIDTIPDITGSSTDIFLTTDLHFVEYSKYYLGRVYRRVLNSEKKTIMDKIDIDNMDSYPYGNYVTIVDDVIVVKLSE